MVDTVDRLVRILDEERSGHREARQHAGQLAQHLSSEQRALELLRKENAEARKKIEELEAWIDHLFDQVPASKRAGWATRPTKFDDIPF